MSNALEFNGKNVDRALAKASDALNIPVEKINHEVVTYGSSGIFGLVGVKKAKIKVYVQDKPKTAVAQRESDKRKENTALDKAMASDSVETSGKDEQDLLLSEAIIESGREALQKMIDHISDGASIEIVRQPEQLCYGISGGESGVLIGKRGQTLEAMQYLLEKMINKKATSRIRVVVDVEGYLEKRKDNLRQMATRMAEKAKRIRKPVTIGQMNAHDRRIVHIHLKDESGVRTQSIGEGYYRKLMIFPKKSGFGKKNSRQSDS